MRSTILVLALVALARAAFAEVPIQFAAPNVRAPDDPQVSRMRFSVLHGENERVSGVDFGMQRGANIGFINITDDYAMLDIGGVNVAERSTVQLGFLNVTQKLESFQFGFLNIAENGFLPVFPTFNFPKR
jgi:hypothetical protein